MTYTTIDRILSKFHRDLKGTEISETDLIEWVGEALDFMDIYQLSNQEVIYLKIRNHSATLPSSIKAILQVAKYDGDISTTDVICNQIVEEEVKKETKCCITDECGTRVEIIEKPPHWQWLFTKIDFPRWTANGYYRKLFKPIRPSQNTFFKDIICKEKDQSIYKNCADEYVLEKGIPMTIKTSFREGLIAVAALTSVRDEDGLPLIPDHISVITAITYYIQWKLAEWYVWNKREGYSTIAERAEAHWLKYVRQAKSSLKMPKTIDDYQNLLEESHNIPDLTKYYRFYSDLGKHKTWNT